MAVPGSRRRATYDAGNSRGGLLFPQFNLRNYPEVFPIYQPGLRILPPPQRFSTFNPSRFDIEIYRWLRPGTMT